MAINIADVVSQFGAYYIKNDTNMQRLRAMLYQPVETAKYFQERPGDDTVYRAVLSTLNRIVQPFQKAFTAIGTTTFKPNSFPLFKLKVDMTETPDDLEASYLGFLAAAQDLDRKNWPFIRWMVEVHVMGKIQEDLENNEYFAGVYAAPTSGTAGAAGTAMNGLRKVIRDYNTASRLNLGNGPIVTGAAAASAADFVTQVEEFVEDIPSLFRSRIDHIFMSKELQTKYRQGKRAKYNTNYLQSTDLLTLEDHSHISVVGLSSMSAASTGMYFATLKENRIRATKKAALANSMKIESAKRAVDLMTDWWEALNFEVPEFVFVNDQDLS